MFFLCIWSRRSNEEAAHIFISMVIYFWFDFAHCVAMNREGGFQERKDSLSLKHQGHQGDINQKNLTQIEQIRCCTKRTLK